MENKTNEITVGLFGTCGDSKWREPFMERFDAINAKYFNPQVDNWDPSMAEIEAEHLAKDEIILFPITSETYGMGSLAETGFSILQAIKLESNRDFVLLVDAKPDSHLEEENPMLFKESCRARALIKHHLKQLKLANVYLVETLEEMLEVSEVLYSAAVTKQKVNKYFLQ